MASGTITGTTSNKYISAKIEWSSTADTANNKSTVTAKLYYMKSTASTTATSGVINATITINGNKYTYNSGNSKTLPVDGKWYYITEHEVVVAHNSDGKKSITISATGGMTGSSFTSTSLSGTAVLTDIPRKATITSAPNFTDSDNPTVYYSNPAGSAVDSLKICISSTGASDDIASYRSCSQTGSSYTFYLTSAEISRLRALVTSGSSASVKFYLKTTIGGTDYYSTVTKTFTISDTSVTFSYSIYDTNSLTTSLTGDSSKIVKGYSNVYYSYSAKSNSGATITSNSISCGTQYSTATSGTFNKVESASFVLKATDSRGGNFSTTVTKTLINYFKPTLNMTVYPPNASGDMILVFTGAFYNASFGSSTNTITVRYSISHEDSGFSQGGAVTLTKSGNNFTGQVNITGLDYKNVYVISANAYDLLDEIQLEPVRAIGTPVFDWGKEDFSFHCKVNMDMSDAIYGTNTSGEKVEALMPCNGYNNLSLGYGGYNNGEGATDIWGNYVTVYCKNDIDLRSNTHCYNNLEVDGSINVDYDVNCVNTVNAARVCINSKDVGVQTTLKSGINQYMNDSQSFTLSGTSALSKQLTGYIMVWSYYSGGTTYVNCTNYTFIPKSVLGYNGGRISMPLVLDDGTCGAKSLIITETSGVTTVQGESRNGNAPNTNWVLNKVIGY